jgi:predicted MPP superfamily phosphohydrolase
MLRKFGVGVDFRLIYWTVSLIILFYLVMILVNKSYQRKDVRYQKKTFNFFGLFILVYIPKLVFSVFSVIEDILIYIAENVFQITISSIIITQSGLILAVVLFLILLYGILAGRFYFKTERISVVHKALPGEFNGLKLVHISDLHIGSWKGHKRHLKKVVRKINKEQPDWIVFTGDLFNNFYEEIEDFKELLKSIQSKNGKLAVLGNHDYGDYFFWNSNQEKNANFEKIKKAYSDIGFRLLCNESLTLEKNGSKISFSGVENWGLPPFHQYGDLQKALSQIDESKFIILLSHDPSHWKEEIAGMENIPLTLSGHTHGMQFGIYTKGFRWSPSKLKYPEWGGLYRLNDQLLYVNKGLGYIGFPGRIGIRPEITVLTLGNKKGPA